MEYVIGVVLALAISLFAKAIGFDRDRSFYPTVLIVIASYYLLFAVMSGSIRALIAESLIMVGFLLLAAFGFKRSLWLVVGGLVGHGGFDSIHKGLIHNPGVPSWWPMFCLAFDVTAGGYLAWRLSQRSGPAEAPAL